jgi:hypothetical protein
MKSNLGPYWKKAGRSSERRVMDRNPRPDSALRTKLVTPKLGDREESPRVINLKTDDDTLSFAGKSTTLHTRHPSGEKSAVPRSAARSEIKERFSYKVGENSFLVLEEVDQ